MCSYPPPPALHSCMKSVYVESIQMYALKQKENDIEVILTFLTSFNGKNSSVCGIRVPSAYYDRLFNPELWGPVVTVTEYVKPND